MNIKSSSIDEKSIARRVSISGVTVGFYVIIMYLTQEFSFGQYQIRMATSLYALSAVYPFLTIPLAVGNMLSNTLMGGLGVFDTLGGFLVGIITAGSISLIKKLNLSDWLIALPIVFGPGLTVPIWLSYILNVPYKVLAVSLCIGQVIPGIAGVIIYRSLKNKI